MRDYLRCLVSEFLDFSAPQNNPKKTLIVFKMQVKPDSCPRGNNVGLQGHRDP